MSIAANPRLFWFLKENTRLELEETSTLDFYVQQVLTRGNFEDIKALLSTVKEERFRSSFSRIRNFLPADIRAFWEHYLGNYSASSAIPS